MGDKSAIQWTEATWNPVTGCSKVSPGCAHCYAETLTRRFAHTWGVPDLPWTPANASENVVLHRERLEQPLKWKRPRLIFVNSMSDLFHELVPSTFIYDVFNVMRECPQHTFQILTKRPERMQAELRGLPLREFWPHVWLGTSIENRRFVDRADWLRLAEPAVRFISAEPLLGPLIAPRLGLPWEQPARDDTCYRWVDGRDGPELNLTGIDWLIVGGESGLRYRPARIEWARDLRDAALANGTAFFFKQWGGRTPKSGGRELDGRTWDEMPQAAISAEPVPEGSLF